MTDVDETIREINNSVWLYADEATFRRWLHTLIDAYREQEALMGRQAEMAEVGMYAAIDAGSKRLEQAEASPDALDSERAENARLTAELEAMTAERDLIQEAIIDTLPEIEREAESGLTSMRRITDILTAAAKGRPRPPEYDND